jgi:hypothetical protein
MSRFLPFLVCDARLCFFAFALCLIFSSFAMPQPSGRRSLAPLAARTAAAELPWLKVTHVRLHEHHAQVVIDFAPLPTRALDIQLEGQRWRVDALLDRTLP